MTVVFIKKNTNFTLLETLWSILESTRCQCSCSKVKKKQKIKKKTENLDNIRFFSHFFQIIFFHRYPA